MPLLNKLKPAAKAVKARDAGPLWRGPCAEGPLGGVTFSLLSAFTQCRERFRIKYMLGLRPPDGFSHQLYYGNMWHECEEAHAKGYEWGTVLHKYVEALYKKFPLQREQVDKWYRACQMQFPIYVDYWSKHKDVEQRTPLMQEQVFDVPYQLPSGRCVRLRGKFYSVDLIGKGKAAGVYLKENKTKGDVDPDALKQQLTMDMQCMMYLVALREFNWVGTKYGPPSKTDLKHPLPMMLPAIKGMTYNVVRRPLSGGCKGTITQLEGSKGVKCPKCKELPEFMKSCPKCGGAGRINPKPAETTDHYWKRVQQYFINEPELFFMRWKVEVSPDEVKDFQRRCLNPLLEQVCDWYEWIASNDDPFAHDVSLRHNAVHWQHPFGAENRINDGYGRDVDEYIRTGSEVGLVRRTKLFEELQ